MDAMLSGLQTRDALNARTLSAPAAARSMTPPMTMTMCIIKTPSPGTGQTRAT
jgi:hypothetical protein